MSDCLTCAKSANDDGKFLAIGADKDMQMALCKHFWFEEDQYLQSIICYPCWHKIDEFHRFYREVKQLHTRPLGTKLRVEQEDQQVGFALGSAEHVVKLEAEVLETVNESSVIKVEDHGIEFSSVLSEQNECLSSNLQDLQNNRSHVVVSNPDLVVIEKEEQLDIDFEPSELLSDCMEVEAIEEAAPNNDENDKDRSSNKRTICRKRLQQNVKDAVQKYVSKHLTLECDTCFQRCSSFEILQRHSMMEHAKTATVLCCNLRLSDSYRFVDHIRFHLDPNVFMCSLCSKRCGYRGELKKHLRLAHHPADMEKSAEKVKSKAIKTVVVNEQKSDDSDYSNSSDDEGDDDSDVNWNLKTFGNPLRLSSEEKGNIRLFVSKNINLECDTCSKKFTSFTKLQKHSLTRHRKRANVLCCTRKISSKSRFDDHMLFHVNPDRFMCTKCIKKCPNWESLKRHMQQMHTPESEKVHHCHICHMKFFSKHALSRHVKFHGEAHSEGAETDRLNVEQFKFRCKVCLKSWTNSESLRHHMRNQHPQEV